MINFIQSLFEKKPFTGVAEDNRSADEKFGDVSHKEFVAAQGNTPWAPVVWSMNVKRKKFAKRDQAYDSSCVMQSNAKARGKTDFDNGGNFPILSAHKYNERSNWPNPGTIPYEGLQITTRGLPLESLSPSQRLTEDQQNLRTPLSKDALASAKDFAGGIPVVLPIDIDVIASVLDMGYGVVLCNDFSSGEYNIYAPITLRGVVRGIHHQIAAVDRTLYNGQKALVCEDSAFLSSTIDGQRIITEDFLVNHCYFAGYVRDVKKPKAKAIAKPKTTFTKDLSVGDKSNDVLVYQQRLVYEGHLASDNMTGYFGGLTFAATKAYQNANGISQTGNVGPKTRAALNA